MFFKNFWVNSEKTSKHNSDKMSLVNVLNIGLHLNLHKNADKSINRNKLQI